MILVSGNGKLARELEKLSTDSMLINILSRKEMDITDEYRVSDVIKDLMMKPNYPKYFVHTAALTKPMDVNDRNPIMSLDTNIVGTANVAKVCSKYGIKFIYISTDFVYDAEKSYRGKCSDIVGEESKVKPSNNYGWSKLGGECAVHHYDNALILRVCMNAVPFPHERAFTDVISSHMYADEAAGVTLKLLDEVGIINVGGKAQSVYDFVVEHEPNVGKISVNEVIDVEVNTNSSMNIKKMEKLLI